MLYKWAVIVLLTIVTVSAASAEDRTVLAVRSADRPAAGESQCALPQVTETVEYYEVQGTCEKDLRQQLSRKGIVWSDGRMYDSVTDWELKWDYGYQRHVDSCSIDSFKVDVDIRYRYPKWIRPGDVPGALVDKWEAYLRNLADHEQLHRHHVVEAAKELSQAVAALPPAKSCADLDHEIRCLCNEKMKELREYQERYDIVSGHGAAQGAVFP